MIPVTFFSRHLGIRALFVFGSIFSIGCVSGHSGRSPLFAPELPTELPKEVKEKFDVKDAVEALPKKPPALMEASQKKGSSKKKGSKYSKAARTKVAALPHEVTSAPALGTSTPDPHFKYPNRRSALNPIWLEEKLTFSISYLGIAAGYFTLEVLPYKFIDRRKVYHVRGTAETSSIFSLFYRLNDTVETFFDYEGYFSHRFHILLDESKQNRDSLELNDSEKKQTFFWNRWHPKGEGLKEVKEFFPMTPFPQDSLSALYYLRTVPLPNGAEVSFPVVSEGKTWECVCHVEKREWRNTPMGKIRGIVIRLETKYQGVLKKQGDSFLWLTDDDRRIPIRLEAKVKIGTVSANLTDVEFGKAPEKEPSVDPASIPSAVPSLGPSSP